MLSFSLLVASNVPWVCDRLLLRSLISFSWFATTVFVFANVSFNEETDDKNKYLLEDEGNEECEVYIICCNEEDVYEVDEVEE